MVQNNKKIFIIDNDIGDLKTMKSILEKKGYSVGSSTNGAEAIDILSKRKFEPDLILIDILMPTLSGYDVLRLLRDRVKKGIKLIYVTIVPKQEVNLREVDGFIQKPFSPSEFAGKIKKILEN